MWRFLIWMLIICLPIAGLAQFRNQDSNTHPIEQYLHTPENSLGFPTNVGSLLDPSRMHMSYGYSMAYASSNQGSIMQGAFTTDMIYDLSRPITLMFRLGYLHEPYNTYLPDGMTSQGQVFGGAGLTYRPTKDIVFQFEFQHIPGSILTYQSPFYHPVSPWGYHY
jgi:hypothetical protein